MKKNKVMIVGPRQSGKSSLANKLNKIDGDPKKTPNMVYGKRTLDIPGTYLESPWMHSHLIAAQQDACCVVMISDPTSKKINYPPGFSKSFRLPVLGVIVKMDREDKNISFSEKELEHSGVKRPFYRISLINNEGIKELEETIKDIEEKARGKGGD